MPDRPRKKKRPRDLNVLAKTIVDIVTEGEPAEEPSKKTRTPSLWAAWEVPRVGKLCREVDPRAAKRDC